MVSGPHKGEKVMRIAGIFAASCCSLFTTAAHAESTAEVLRAFGLIGTWSVDCAKDIRHEFGARITYTESPAGPPIIRTVSNSFLGITTHDEQILSAERVGDEKIKLKIWSLETGQVEKGGRTASYHVAPGEGTVILEKVGSKLRPFERSTIDGKVVSWKDGKMSDGSPIRLQERCTMRAMRMVRSLLCGGLLEGGWRPAGGRFKTGSRTKLERPRLK
jgi:hypothetical protein